MRKLKLLLVTLALIVGGALSIKAYTTDNLESAGWTKVTTSSISGIDDNYYMLVDANSSAYVMANDANHFRPCYKTLADPVANPSFVWILEGSENSFNLKSFSTGAYFKQDSGWNTAMGYARDNRTKVTCLFTLSGEKYTTKCVETNNFIGHWNDDGAPVKEDGESIAANKGESNAPGFYLYAIPRSTFIAALSASRFTSVSAATKASPADVTSYIQNADWSSDWGGWECTFTSSGNMQWTGKKALESWNASNVVIKQELKGVPNGRYKLTADVISGPGATRAAYVYATGNTKVSSDVVSAEASANNYDTMAGEVIGKTLTADNVNVTGNSITVGIDQSTGWIVADNFTLYYYGPNLAASSALPDGNMTAGTWYYFDVTIAGTYNLTCTTLSDIVYTQDGSILVEDAGSVTTNFSGSSVELAAGRYYVKSLSAQTLTVAAASYSYNVGAATSSITEGSYIQTLTTVSFAFTEATSNDPGASFVLLNGSAVATLKKEGSEVKTGTLSLEGTTLTATFSDVTLDVASAYSVEIPAGVVGYAGEEQNAAATVNFNTPTIKNGVYYMLNNATKTYISRSGSYATQAILDNYGLAFIVETDASNNTKLQYFDSHLWLGDDGNCYGDCSGDRVRSFNVTAVPGGYKFLNTKNSKYLASNTNITVANAEDGSNAIWTVESTAAHVDNYTANADAQAATAATAAGMTGITTKAALDAELESNYGATNVVITGAKAEKFQQYAGSSSALSENTYYSETINDLKPGLYKLSVDAFQRAAGNDRVAAADGARSLIYLYAGDAKTQLKSVMDYGADAAYAGDFAYDGKHYPNNEASAYVALATNNYKNEVYVYVADAGEGTGSLAIGIKMPSRLGGDFSTWAVYNNWSLTLFEAKATADEKTALANAITAAGAKTLGFETGEYAPYANAAALEALAAAKAIDPENASGTSVVAATTALTSATWTANASEKNAIAYGDLSSYETVGGKDYPYGWSKYDDGSRIMGGSEGTTNAGLSASSTGKAMLVKYNAKYGEQVGYTMPLKAGQLYKISFNYCGWGNNPTTNVVIKKPNGTSVTVENASFKPATNDGNSDAAHWYEYTGSFTADVAGDYVLELNKVETGQQQIAWADMQLVKTQEVSANMTITSAKYATFIAPFDVAIPSGVTASKVLAAEDKTLTLTPVETTIPANTPVVLYKDVTGTDFTQDFNGADRSTKNTYTVGLLTGVYADTPATPGTYVLQNQSGTVAFYKVTSGNEPTVGKNRAYVNAGAFGAGIKAFFFDEDETTAIEGLDVLTSGEYDAIYNAAGIQVEALQKGLNIVVKDGKSYKIYVK